ncbi:MAG TPA: lipid II flippase MurJ, partial [Candidatus Saccharimonadaceae bacterium]|nr:lipid II flippase MurJ [Candidatus Saccharimonadaceae bacterium]
GALAVAILFRSIYYIAARSFYAQQDTKTPLYISMFTVGLNIALAIWFTRGLGMGAYGLAWAESIVSIVEVIILFIVLSTRVPRLFDRRIASAMWRMLSASGFTALFCYAMVLLFPLRSTDQSFFSTFPKFALIVAVSLVVYVFICDQLHLEEPRPVIRRAREFLLARMGLER